jgi:putative ABC transport system permease protein
VFFSSLILRNVFTRKVRATLTGLTVALSIMTVVTMGVLTHSLRQTAISVLKTGTADFTVAQEGVSDVIYSAIDEGDLAEIRAMEGVASLVGVLVAPTELDDEHPFFLRLGVEPDEIEDFGVHVVVGRAYESTSATEIMLGYRAARDFEKTVGDEFQIGDDTYTIVGLFSTGQVFGDSAAMLPLSPLQAGQRKPGIVTLAFVRVSAGTDVERLRSEIESALPQLATVRTESEFGRVDRNLELISAANVGVSALALAVGAIMVMNTMVLSVFERTREFGVLRAEGWSRRRILALVMGEALVVTLVGAGLGVGFGFFAIAVLKDTPALLGVFQPEYPAAVFARALGITFGMALAGAFYPAARAALLAPLDAIRHE